MASIDLGEPVLLLILVFWGVFAVLAIISTFVKRGNLEDLKRTLRGFFDETSHGKGSR